MPDARERVEALEKAVARNLHETREMASPDKVALSAVHANEFSLADLGWLLRVARAAVAWREAGWADSPDRVAALIAAVDDAEQP